MHLLLLSVALYHDVVCTSSTKDFCGQDVNIIHDMHKTQSFQMSPVRLCVSSSFGTKIPVFLLFSRLRHFNHFSDRKSQCSSLSSAQHRMKYFTSKKREVEAKSREVRVYRYSSASWLWGKGKVTACSWARAASSLRNSQKITAE